jgi:hypothetical protein
VTLGAVYDAASGRQPATLVGCDNDHIKLGLTGRAACMTREQPPATRAPQRHVVGNA